MHAPAVAKKSLSASPLEFLQNRWTCGPIKRAKWDRKKLCEQGFQGIASSGPGPTPVSVGAAWEVDVMAGPEHSAVGLAGLLVE